MGSSWVSGVVLSKRKEISNSGGKNKRSINFQWAFGLNRISLSMIGVWPRESSGRQSFEHLRIPVMVLWLLLGLFLPQMYALSMIYRELPLVVDNFTTSCAALTSSIKLFLFWHSRQVLEPVIRIVMSDWAQERPAWELGVMAKQARRARLFTLSGYVLMFVCFIGFIASPFFGLSIRIINNITDPLDGRYLPLQAAYPYALEKSPYFELTYASQVIAGSFVGIAFSVPDNFFGALVFHACAQCEILGTRMGKLIPASSRAVANGRGSLRQRLRACVSSHVDLMRFIGAVEKSFNLLILVQVLCLSLIICCLGFGVIKSVESRTGRPPVIQIITLSGTLMNIMIHMLIYCIASEILAQHSYGFSRSIYSSNWYSLPRTCARDIIMIMIQSKTPLRLSAGKFFYLSLNSYLNIIKTSAGYISMLLTVSN